MSWVSAIVSLIKAIPIINGWFEKIAEYWYEQRIIAMKKELADAIEKARQGDQRDLEKYIGSPRAGKPSGLPGSELVDSLPGVPKVDKK
jgi:hypothetical protein